MSDGPSCACLSRGDFLKLAGLASLGFLIGAAGRSEAVQGNAQRLYVVTHGPDDVDRAALALLLASIDAKRIGKEIAGVTIWFTLQGARLCKRGEAEKLASSIFRKFGTLSDILKGAVEAGARVAACPFCLDAFGIERAEYIAGLERKGATSSPPASAGPT